VADNGQSFVERNCLQLPGVRFLFNYIIVTVLQEPATKLYPIQMNSVCNHTPFF